ncbi:LppM family (lipo)protein [Actinomyces sp. W5033]|uniref:LppM family (lipo)protein n=1 Tax=Actinomyces sp. W5033 TaxID=3446479 RepID=UPI003EE10323
MPTLPRHRPALRRHRTLALTGLAAATLAGCTAHMDMTLSEEGTYDVVLDIRDSTGTVLTAGTSCADYADPALVGAPEGTSVTSRPVGSDTDPSGIGCEVTIRGVAVPEASAVGTSPEGSTPLVVRDGDLYVVDLSALQGASQAEVATGQDGQAPLAGAVDARVSLTFPGAVVESGGGLVEGSTVTWSDVEVLSSGVSASGYASRGVGLGLWDRYWGWAVGAVALAGAGLGAGAWHRWTRTR